MSLHQQREPLRVGILGFGYWGPTLARNFATLPNAELVAICDLAPANRERAHRLHQGVELFDSFEEMLSKANLDAISIATPADRHYHFASRALKYGLHVLVEKPMTLNSREGLSLVQLAKRKQRTLMVDHTYLYSPVFTEISRLVSSGELGELRHVACQRRSLGLFQKHMNAAWDLAPHDLSILTALFGELPSVVSCQATSVMGGQQEDVANITLTYPNGGFATIQSSWIEPRKVRQMTFVGTCKMAVYDDLEPLEKLRIYNSHVELPPHYDDFAEFQCAYHYGDCLIPHLKQGEPVKRMCDHFIHCCLTGETPRTSGESALGIVAILEAAESSLRQNGKPTTPILPDLEERPLQNLESTPLLQQ